MLAARPSIAQELHALRCHAGLSISRKQNYQQLGRSFGHVPRASPGSSELHAPAPAPSSVLDRARALKAQVQRKKPQQGTLPVRNQDQRLAARDEVWQTAFKAVVTALQSSPPSSPQEQGTPTGGLAQQRVPAVSTPLLPITVRRGPVLAQQQDIPTITDAATQAAVLRSAAPMEGPMKAGKLDFSLQTGLAVAWLGTSSGAPTKARNVSCTLLRTPDAVYMVDCGEGSRRQLEQVDVDPALVDCIFITHLHGDHCFGTANMLVHLDAAKQQLKDPARRHNRIVGPVGLADLLRASLGATGLIHELELPLLITELVVEPSEAHKPCVLLQDSGVAPHVMVQRLASELVADDPELMANVAALNREQPKLPSIWRPRMRSAYTVGLDASRGFGFEAAPDVFWNLPAGPNIRVRAANLQHRVPCWGYVFSELTPAGNDDGSVGGLPGRKVVLLGDTVDSRCIAPLAYGTDMLSHEATFQAGMEHKATIAQHSTGWMAGMFARAIHARSLVLTHFSARYNFGEYGYASPPGQRPQMDDQDELREQNSAVRSLIAEAREEFPEGAIYAARDFYVLHVPPRAAGASPTAPRPASQEEQARSAGGSIVQYAMVP